MIDPDLASNRIITSDPSSGRTQTVRLVFDERALLKLMSSTFESPGVGTYVNYMGEKFVVTAVHYVDTPVTLTIDMEQANSGNFPLMPASNTPITFGDWNAGNVAASAGTHSPGSLPGTLPPAPAPAMPVNIQMLFGQTIGGYPRKDVTWVDHDNFNDAIAPGASGYPTRAIGELLNNGLMRNPNRDHKRSIEFTASKDIQEALFNIGTGKNLSEIEKTTLFMSTLLRIKQERTPIGHFCVHFCGGDGFGDPLWLERVTLGILESLMLAGDCIETNLDLRVSTEKRSDGVSLMVDTTIEEAILSNKLLSGAHPITAGIVGQAHMADLVIYFYDGMPPTFNREDMDYAFKAGIPIIHFALPSKENDDFGSPILTQPF